ncbi:MAG: hypothetical protein L0Y50_05855 [Beijerinckiaceae bacterium]|nr:hypothetical protein [Beijerinckiaceae bacterium]MCI0735783.1 hypothetical protein [Beijerinckiaceae bacterium]
MLRQGLFIESWKDGRPVRPVVWRWGTMVLALCFSIDLLCVRAGAAGTAYEKWEEALKTAVEPMRVRVVRSARPGCEPACAEWVSFEGDVDLQSTHEFGVVVNSLHGRKLPVLIHSEGGNVAYAMRIGSLIRLRGLDVAVARTEFEPCSNSSSGCEPGDGSGARGRPSSQPAHCFSACTFILAGGVRRLIAPGAQIGVHSGHLREEYVEKLRRLSQVESLRRFYRGKIPLDEVVQQRQQQLLQDGNTTARLYFEKNGIAAEILDLIESTPSAEMRILFESELTRMKLVTDLKAGQSFVEQLSK